MFRPRRGRRSPRAPSPPRRIHGAWGPGLIAHDAGFAASPPDFTAADVRIAPLTAWRGRAPATTTGASRVPTAPAVETGRETCD